MRSFLYSHYDAFIGIFGTLSGVILGAIINQYSRRGKLIIFKKDFKIEISKQSKNGSFQKQDKLDIDTSIVSINFELDIQNTSTDQKNGREVYFVIRNKKYVGIKDIKLGIKDLGTLDYSSGISHIKSLEYFNIPPKTILNYKLYTSVRKEDYHYIENASFYFEYKDNKNRKKTITLLKP